MPSSLQAHKKKDQEEIVFTKRELTGDVQLENLRTRFGARPEPLQRPGFSLPKQSFHKPDASGYLTGPDNYELQIK